MKLSTAAMHLSRVRTGQGIIVGSMILNVVVSVWLTLAVLMGTLVLWESRGRL